MEIAVADERVFIIKPKLTFDEAKKQAGEKKVDAFGAINKVASFLSKPKDDDFELLYEEFRYQPFWYIVAHARSVFDRQTAYKIPITAPEVHAITFEGKNFTVTNDHIDISITEHCKQEEKEEVCIDGITSQSQPNLQLYLSAPATECPNDVVTGQVPKQAIVVPPKTRASAIVRDIVGKLMHGVQADAVFEEDLSVERVDLYYRPMYAFRFKWVSKNKEAILEFDGVTGDVRTGERTFQEYVGKILDTQFLFDIGADAAGMVVPGGGIAVKLAKRYIDKRRK